MITSLLFYAFSLILVLSALGVITSRNPVHAALFLVLAFVQSAMLWLLLEAEFLAVVLVLVYVGAVMVLFLFVVMMLDINVEELRTGFTRYLPIGAAVAFVVVLEIGHVIWFRSQDVLAVATPEPYPPGYSNTKALGSVLYTEHVYAFELGGDDPVAGHRRRHHPDHAPAGPASRCRISPGRWPSGPRIACGW